METDHNRTPKLQINTKLVQGNIKQPKENHLLQRGRFFCSPFESLLVWGAYVGGLGNLLKVCV